MAMQSSPGDADGMAPHGDGKEGKQDPREPKGADTLTGMAFPADMQEMVKAWSDPEFLGQFMTVERLPDQSVADQQAAVFQTNFNLRSLMDSAEFHELLGVTGELGGMDEDDVSGIAMMVGMMTLGLDIESLEFINLDDGLPLREELHLNWDLSALINLADSSELESSFGLDLLIDFSFSDEELPVTAPEGALPDADGSDDGRLCMTTPDPAWRARQKQRCARFCSALPSSFEMTRSDAQSGERHVAGKRGRR